MFMTIAALHSDFLFFQPQIAACSQNVGSCVVPKLS